MLLCKKGFTFIELLVVIVIITLAAGLVAPVVHRGVERFNNFLDKKEEMFLKNKKDYLSFIKDESCTIKNNLIVCGDKVYSSFQDVIKK